MKDRYPKDEKGIRATPWAEYPEEVEGNAFTHQILKMVGMSKNHEEELQGEEYLGSNLTLPALYKFADLVIIEEGILDFPALLSPEFMEHDELDESRMSAVRTLYENHLIQARYNKSRDLYEFRLSEKGKSVLLGMIDFGI